MNAGINMSSMDRRRSRRMIAVCGLAIFLSSQVVSGMPYAQSSQGSSVPKIHTPEELQEYISTFLDQHNRYENRASGYEGIHPLNRRGWGGAPEEIHYKPQRRQTTTTALSSVVAADDSSSTTAAAVATTATSSSLPGVTPLSSSTSTSTKSSSSSKASKTASSTATSTSSSASGVLGFFSPHNKLFPLAIAVCVAIGIGVMLIAISIAKMVAHSKMTPEEKAGEYGDGYERAGKKDGGIAIRGARSIKRAFTKKKLGSFARRNQEGSVLIEVGDEVYAVTPEVAREYERERSNMGGSSGGSRLTTGSASASTLRQALKNAEMIVASNGAGGAGAQVANVQPVPKSFDINSWRASAALPGITNLQNEDGQGVSRTMSQRLTDGLRALRGDAIVDKDPYNRPTGGAFSFDSEKQDFGGMRQAEVPASSYLPVITRGAKEWEISPQREMKSNNLRPLQSKSNSDSSSREGSELSHERHTLTDGPVPSRSKTVKIRQPSSGANIDRRPKSILVKRGEQEEPGVYRHRKPHPAGENVLPYNDSSLQRKKTAHRPQPQMRRHNSSTSCASPKMLQGRTTAATSSSSPIFIKPSKPTKAAAAPANAANADRGAARSTETNAPHTRDLFRPLPPPPAFSPLS